MDKVESKHSLRTFAVKPDNANAGYFNAASDKEQPLSLFICHLILVIAPEIVQCSLGIEAGYPPAMTNTK
jgi:hypothetical protein